MSRQSLEPRKKTESKWHYERRITRIAALDQNIKFHDEPHQTGKNAPELLYSGSAAPPRPVPGAGAMLISRKSLNNAFLEDGEKAEDVARLNSRRARDSFIVNTLFCWVMRGVMCDAMIDDVWWCGT